MRGISSDAELWAKINRVILDDNAAVVLVTLIDGMCSLLMHSGVAASSDDARVHLAALVLSPDDGRPAGSLIPRLQAECARLEDGKWRQ
jgi:hypothetical protein